MLNRFHYNIETIDEDRYKVVLDTDVKGTLFNKAFQMAKKKLKKKGILNVGNAEVIEEFEIPGSLREQYLPHIKRAIQKAMSDIRKQVRKDGIQLISFDVENAVYRRNSQGNWTVLIYVNGVYVRKDKNGK